MSERHLLERDPLFSNEDTQQIWDKYCGFLDLSIGEFMIIQEQLLVKQLEIFAYSTIGKRILKGQKPKGIEEFRQMVPFTNYEDYEPYFNTKKEEVLSEKPIIWAYTSGMSGFPKWTPYTRDSLNRLADNTIAALILSSATHKGEVHVHDGIKMVLNLLPIPYISGIMSFAAGHLLDYEAIPPLAESAKMQFEERIKESFKIALSSGIDYACSLAAILVKVGESYAQIGGKRKFFLPSQHPKAVLRLLRAVIQSKLMGRPLLPKDLWKVKGLVCSGADTSVFRDAITYYWGVQPLGIYITTESGFIAMQGWNKKGMTFIPYTNFYEFIPEEEWLKSRGDLNYCPKTILLDEVEAGKTYEIVITNFNGGAFIRYRIGDLIKIVAVNDEETEVNLPQMVYLCRADELIDILGLSRLDENILWRAIQNLGIPYVDWTARKEYISGKPMVHIYIETIENVNQENICHSLDEELIILDKDYEHFRNLMEFNPLKVTLLKQGAFQEYLQSGQIKPPHINASEKMIGILLH